MGDFFGKLWCMIEEKVGVIMIEWISLNFNGIVHFFIMVAEKQHVP